MHSDPAEVRRSVKRYVTVGVALLICTAITVAANRFHFAIPLAITIALIIAITKGSMVATVFMHLSSERRWIYGGLMLAALGFLILMTVPFFTIEDTIGTSLQTATAAERLDH